MAVAAGGRVFPPRKRSEPSRTTAEANAALIVHAVNCHDELVTALEYVFDHIADKNRGPRDLYPAFGLDAGRALEMVRAAIAKARGEQ
jgi:hypothetical protein